MERIRIILLKALGYERLVAQRDGLLRMQVAHDAQVSNLEAERNLYRTLYYRVLRK